MNLGTLSACFLILLPLGCATTASAPGPTPAAPSGEGADSSEEARRIERDLRIARERLEVARLEEASYQAEQQVRLRHAMVEVELADSSLAQFVEADMPNKLASERLALRSAQDRAQEAAEELAQIEIMYQDQDLDDVTAEFVVSRGRRNAERAAARIQVMESELQALEERELPRETRRRQLAVDRAKAELEEIRRQGEIGARNKAISVEEAHNKVEELERKLSELSAEADA